MQFLFAFGVYFLIFCSAWLGSWSGWCDLECRFRLPVSSRYRDRMVNPPWTLWQYMWRRK